MMGTSAQIYVHLNVYSVTLAQTETVWKPVCHLLIVQETKTRSRCFPNRELS